MLTLGIINTLNSVYTEISDEEKAKAEAAEKAEATKLAEAEATKLAEAEAGELAKLDDEEKVPIADLRKIRAEAAGYRKQLRALEEERDASTKAREKADQEAEIAKLEGIEAEKARTQQAIKDLDIANAAVAAKETELKINMVSEAVYRAANTAGFLHPEDVIKLLDADEIEVVDGKIDDDVITEMIGTLAESRPNLLEGEEKGANYGGGPTNPASKQAPGPRLTDDAKTAALRRELADGIKTGTITGHAILKMRRKIRESYQGASVKKERGG